MRLPLFNLTKLTAFISYYNYNTYYISVTSRKNHVSDVFFQNKFYALFLIFEQSSIK